MPNYAQLPCIMCNIVRYHESPLLSLSYDKLLLMPLLLHSPIPQVSRDTKLANRMGSSFNIIEIRHSRVFTIHCLIIRCCVIMISILLQFTTLFACYRVLCPSYKDCCLHFLSSFWSVHWGLKVFVQLWFKDSTVSSSLISTIFLVQWCSIIHFVKRNPRPAFCHSVEELFSAAATGNSIVSFTYHQRFLQMHWFLNNRDSSRDSSDALLFSSRLGRAGKYCNQVQVSRSDEFLWNEDVLERARQVF